MFTNLLEFISSVPDEAACRDYIAKQRWENGIAVCPKCGHNRCYTVYGGKKYKCASSKCYKVFSVTVGTIMEASNIPLRKWLTGIYIVSSHKKGISSYQLGRDLGIAQKNAWFMLHRIREMLRINQVLEMDEVQVDEVHIGGKEGNKHSNKKTPKDDMGVRRSVKTSVMGIYNKDQVIMRVLPWVTKRSTGEFVREVLKPEGRLITDSDPIFYHLGKEFEHYIINHNKGEYKNGDFHTNGVENLWSHLQRGIYGIYHQVSPKHLNRYCDEFAFRYNHRKIKDHQRFALSFANLERRLDYRTLITIPEPPKEVPMQEPDFD